VKTTKSATIEQGWNTSLFQLCVYYIMHVYNAFDSKGRYAES